MIQTPPPPKKKNKQQQQKICYHLKLKFYYYFFPQKQNLPTNSLYIYFLLDVNFDKSIIRLHFLIILFMLAKFSKNKKLITMSVIKYLYFKFS